MLNISPMIDINDITVQIGSKVLLDHASAHISDKQKVGLIGANGSGKSTLFKVLKGEMGTQTGSVSFPARYKISSVLQEFQDIDISILDFVLSQDKERTELLKQLQCASDSEVADIHERLNMIGASSAQARAISILIGLGFKQSDIDRNLSEFSGGWRMRVALAAALFAPSDVLLLDEPTNHLDLEASIWLENHLKSYKGTLLLISHDKHILNSLCDHILHLHDKTLTFYKGNYDTFELTHAQKQELLVKLIQKQEEKRAHLQSFVDRFRYKATKAKQAQSRLKMLQKMETIAPLEENLSSHFSFPQPEHLAPPIITLDDVSVGYTDIPVLKKLNLRIDGDDRIALLGANGNGKSTFAKLLAGRLKPMSGTIKQSKKVKIGYFAQHQTEELPLNKSPLTHIHTLMPDASETKCRNHLAMFGLNQEKALTPIQNLSGGEKARLLFACMAYDAPALLILDEPTNHLDIQGRDALIEALNAYEGAVLLITHDMTLIQLIAERLWLVKNGTCQSFDGDLDDYRTLLLEDNKPSISIKENSTLSRKEERQKKAAIRTELAPLKKELSSIEKKISMLTDQKEELISQFETTFNADKIVNLQKEVSKIQKEIEELEEKWLSLSESIEQITIKL